MKILSSLGQLKRWRAQQKEQGQTLALVPTMGALHQGHLSLVDCALSHASAVLVSIFVNPTQFGQGEDFDRYPRSFEQDIEKLRSKGVHACYVPCIEDMYSENFGTLIHVHDLDECLCGLSRPKHFDGVCQVVLKLFHQTQAHVAVFGEKDFQQFLIIQKMVQDLDVPIRVISAPIVREPDGLAMSSRNQYLDEKQRKIAPFLYQEMQALSAKLRADFSEQESLISQSRAKLCDVGFDGVDYLELRDHLLAIPNTHASLSGQRLFASVFLGSTRLIDNISL